MICAIEISESAIFGPCNNPTPTLTLARRASKLTATKIIQKSDTLVEMINDSRSITCNYRIIRPYRILLHNSKMKYVLVSGGTYVCSQQFFEFPFLTLYIRRNGWSWQGSADRLYYVLTCLPRLAPNSCNCPNIFFYSTALQ